MSGDLRASSVEVEDGGSHGGESGKESSGSGTGLDGLAVAMLREIFAAEVRATTSPSSTPSPPRPQASAQEG